MKDKTKFVKPATHGMKGLSRKPMNKVIVARQAWIENITQYLYIIATHT